MGVSYFNILILLLAGKVDQKNLQVRIYHQKIVPSHYRSSMWKKNSWFLEISKEKCWWSGKRCWRWLGGNIHPENKAGGKKNDDDQVIYFEKYDIKNKIKMIMMW